MFTGDLADLGEPDAYRLLRELVEPLAEAIGAQVVWCMGNHDERAAYSRELFGEESEEPQDRVYDVAGLRIVSLDTSVPGWHHGELSDEQLAWLADVLATPAEHGTDPGAAPPADPVADGAGRRDHRAARPERLADVLAAPTSARSSAVTTTSPRTRRSPASRSPSPRPPATPPTPPRSTG